MPRREKPDGFIEPMQALGVDRLPEGAEWIYEVKLDGYRAQAISSRGVEVQLLSRNGLDLGHRFPALSAALAHALPANSVVDGELVALDPEGRPKFNLLQNYASSSAPVVFFAFDLMMLDGEDLTVKPLRARRELLRSWLIPSESVQVSESFQVPAAQIIGTVRELGLEGVVAKRLSSSYETGRRSGAWVKVRVELSQEFVIAGFTPGTHFFDAVLLGFWRHGQLIFCASCRVGFVPASRRTLFARLEPLITDVCPFANLPEAGPGRWGQGITAAKMKSCVWLKPEMVGQFSFLEWTPDQKLRHVSFQGLREDKDAREVVKEDEAIVERKPPQVRSKKASSQESPPMMIHAGDEERGAQRIARLVGRYAERFDPPSRAEFYASLAAKVGRLRDTEVEFIHSDDVPKKHSKSEAGEDATRKLA